MRIETSRLSRAAALLLASVMAVGTLSGCGSIGRHPPAPKSAETPDHRYKIGPLDTLNIVVWRNPELSATVTVRPDGRISTPLVGSTPEEFAKFWAKERADAKTLVEKAQMQID